MSQWAFTRDPLGHWRWQRRNTNNDLIDESNRGFMTEAECVQDARANGYVGSVKEPELKPPPAG